MIIPITMERSNVVTPLSFKNITNQQTITDAKSLPATILSNPTAPPEVTSTLSKVLISRGLTGVSMTTPTSYTDAMSMSNKTNRFVLSTASLEMASVASKKFAPPSSMPGGLVASHEKENDVSTASAGFSEELKFGSASSQKHNDNVTSIFGTSATSVSYTTALQLETQGNQQHTRPLSTLKIYPDSSSPHRFTTAIEALSYSSRKGKLPAKPISTQKSEIYAGYLATMTFESFGTKKTAKSVSLVRRNERRTIGVSSGVDQGFSAATFVQETWSVTSPISLSSISKFKSLISVSYVLSTRPGFSTETNVSALSLTKVQRNPSSRLSVLFSANVTLSAGLSSDISTTAQSVSVSLNTLFMRPFTLVTPNITPFTPEIAPSSPIEQASYVKSFSVERRSTSATLLSTTDVSSNIIASGNQGHLTLESYDITVPFSSTQDIMTRPAKNTPETISTKIIIPTQSWALYSPTSQAVLSREPITVSKNNSTVRQSWAQSRSSLNEEVLSSFQITSFSSSLNTLTGQVNVTVKRSSGISFLPASRMTRISEKNYLIVSSSIQSTSASPSLIVTSSKQFTPATRSHPFMTKKTISSNPKTVPASGQSEPSKKSNVFSSIGAIPSITLHVLSSSIEFSSADASSVFGTRPPPVDPIQWQGLLVLQIPWNSQYESSYTQEFQSLAYKITKELTKVLTKLESFLSLQVQRFWKSSVGVDFVVFTRKKSNIDEHTMQRMLIEANSTAQLDLPIKKLEITGRKLSTLSSAAPTSDSKFLERWKIILIVAAIVIFLLLLIIWILAVKVVRQNGGLKGSNKYDISRRHRKYLYSENFDSITRSKSNLQVIQNIETGEASVERNRFGTLHAYNTTESKSAEKLVEETQEQGLGKGPNEHDNKDHMYEKPVLYKMTRKKDKENPACDRDEIQLQMSTLKANSASTRELSGGSAILELSTLNEGNPSPLECLAYKNEGYDDARL
ncbi:uncharacterized protein [Montipora foliosa]|uniref:uncharacterized protein n=1 Tax=Montipora foliosa TaxID=591990 RepID=UPI0035F20391